MKNNKQLSIFIVEDNLMFQQLIAKQLDSISHSIYFFTSGEACIGGLELIKPDVIILDNNLDGALSGLDTLKSLRQVDEGIYVIMFSTEPELDTHENFEAYGLFEYVEKNDAGFRHLKDKVCKSEVYRLKANIGQA